MSNLFKILALLTFIGLLVGSFILGRHSIGQTENVQLRDSINVIEQVEVVYEKRDSVVIIEKERLKWIDSVKYAMKDSVVVRYLTFEPVYTFDTTMVFQSKDVRLTLNQETSFYPVEEEFRSSYRLSNVEVLKKEKKLGIVAGVGIFYGTKGIDVGGFLGYGYKF